MSIAIMTEAWKVETSPAEKLALLALADYANEQGIAWPSVASLAKKASSSSRTIQRSIRTLEREGHITSEQVPGRACRYHVHPRHNDTPDNASPLSDCQGTPVTVSGDPCQDDTRPCQPVTQTVIYPSVNHHEPSCAVERVVFEAENSFQAQFVEAWNELTRRIGKQPIRRLNPAREKAIKALLAIHSAEDFREAFAKIENSAFLRGDTGSHFFSFDWMLKPANFLKILEGNYDKGPTERDHRDGVEKAIDAQLERIRRAERSASAVLGGEVAGQTILDAAHSGEDWLS